KAMITTSRYIITPKRCLWLAKDEGRVHDLGRRTNPGERRTILKGGPPMTWLKDLINLVAIFASLVEHPGDGPAKKEKVKQMIKDVLPDEEWKIDPEFFDLILDVSIDIVVMF